MKPLLTALSWSRAAVTVVVLGASGLGLKQHADKAGLQARIDALLLRRDQSRAAEEASRARLMAQIRDLQNQLFQAHATINQYQAASRVQVGDQLKGLPASMMEQGQNIGW